MKSLTDGSVYNNGHGTASSKSATSTLYVPDEQSVLQDISNCVLNDNTWLKAQAHTGLFNIGMHILHPRVHRQFTEKMGVPKLSTIVSERLMSEGGSNSAGASGTVHDTLASEYMHVFASNEELHRAVAALVLKSQLERETTFGGGSTASTTMVTSAGPGTSASTSNTSSQQNNNSLLLQGKDTLENIPAILKQ